MKDSLLDLPDRSAVALDSFMAAPRAPERPPETHSASRSCLWFLAIEAGIPGSGANVTETGAGRLDLSSHACRAALDHPTGPSPAPTAGVRACAAGMCQQGGREC